MDTEIEKVIEEHQNGIIGPILKKRTPSSFLLKKKNSTNFYYPKYKNLYDKIF